MKSTKNLIQKFGNPLRNQSAFEAEYMKVWELPANIVQEIPFLPKRIFINKLIEKPFERTINLLILRDLHTEIKTFDGCYNPRYVRGSTTIPSRHAWGLALDFNAAWNALGQEKPDWTPDFIEVWKETGWTFGGDWLTRPDPMHFQWDNF